MSDKAHKVSSASAETGPQGQRYLASGKHVSLRLWQDEQPGEPKPAETRSYETVGYVVSGAADLLIEGETVGLRRGDSWLVPKGAEHTYRIREAFTAVEATSPPAEEHGRDEV